MSSEEDVALSEGSASSERKHRRGRSKGTATSGKKKSKSKGKGKGKGRSKSKGKGKETKETTKSKSKSKRSKSKGGKKSSKKAKKGGSEETGEAEVKKKSKKTAKKSSKTSSSKKSKKAKKSKKSNGGTVAAAGAGGGGDGGDGGDDDEPKKRKPKLGGAKKFNALAKFKGAVRTVMMTLDVVKHMRHESFQYADNETGALKLRTKLLYAAPSFSLLSLTMLISIHAIVFYESLGASLTFIAFFTAVGRSFDVITDPLMGWVSDSTRSRWGRRRPYIGAFCAGYAVAFVMFMSPPKGLSKGGLHSWFGAFYLVFYLFDTISNVPYTAWGPELTDEPVERESVFFWRGLFDKVGVLAGAAGPAVAGAFISSDRGVYTFLAMCFGVYYVVTMYLLVFNLKEREKSMGPPPVPLVPSILRAFKNIAFRPLLGAWVLDYIALGMVSAMLPFFVRHVIVPKEMDDRPDPDTVLGIALGILFVSAGLSMPIWKQLSLRYGKRNIWLAYNLYNSVSTFFFILLGEGDITWCYILSAVNGVPIGGQFLIEAILSDVIDYDEFLNGTRSEGSFTVFATFIPKVVSIPSSAIPLAVISAVGFVPSDQERPEGERDSVQPERVKNTIRVIFCVIPSVCTLASFFLKLAFPIKQEKQTKLITMGIMKHEAGEAAFDPVIDKEGIEILELTKDEQEVAWLLDNFNWETLKVYAEGGKPEHLSLTVKAYLTVGVLLTVGFVTTVALTFPLVDDDTYAWIPSFSSIAGGVSLCFTCVQVLRLRAAWELEKTDVPADLTQRIVEHKKRGQRGGDVASVGDGTKLAKRTVPSDWYSQAHLALGNAEPEDVAMVDVATTSSKIVEEASDSDED